MTDHKTVREALEKMIEACETGNIDSPTLQHPHTGEDVHKWHEEWLLHAEKALAALDRIEAVETVTVDWFKENWPEMKPEIYSFIESLPANGLRIVKGKEK